DCRRDKSISERLEVIAPQLLLFNTNHKSNAMRTEIPGVVHIGVRRATGSTLQRLRQLWRAASARALDQHRLSVGVIRFIIPCIQVPRCAEPFDRTEALVKRGVKNYLQTFYPRHIDRTSEDALENEVVVFHVTCRVCTHDRGGYAVLDVGSRQSDRTVCRKLRLTAAQHPEAPAGADRREVSVFLPSRQINRHLEEIRDFGVEVGAEAVLIVLRRAILVEPIFHDLAQGDVVSHTISRATIYR